MKKTAIVLLGCLFALRVFADNYPKNPHADVQHYIFRIVLSDATDSIRCEATVEVLFIKAGEEYIRLDLVKASAALHNKGMTVGNIAANGQPLSYVHEKDELKIKLPAASRQNERIRIVINYAGIPSTGLKIASNKYGDRTFFSDNWPDKGRNWLPVVDHPYDKSTCEFIVTAPAHYQVVSNGLRIEETDLPGNRRLTHWKQSVPIASWLYVLGVARFAVQKADEFEHKSIETWVYYQDRDAGFYDFAIPSKQALAFYSDKVGPFVYEKLANIQSNSVSGGMEAASAILYSENAVTGDRNTRWRNVVIHEIAHQWFGNAVTEYDWDDVWLSEGFATYFTALFIEHAYGRDAFMEEMASSKRTVNRFAEKNPGYRIVHDNLEDMGKVTSSHTYHKGSWILHMLRGIMGTENFWKGIRAYYARYVNASATTADFRREMEAASGLDLQDFFTQWLYKPGNLVCRGFWEYNEKAKEVILTLEQVQPDALFKMPIQVGVYSANKPQPVIQTIQLNQKTATLKIAADAIPEKIVLDPYNWVLMDAVWEKK